MYPICTTGNCGAVFILYGRCAAIQMVVLRLSGIIITNRGANYKHFPHFSCKTLKIRFISPVGRTPHGRCRRNPSLPALAASRFGGISPSHPPAGHSQFQTPATHRGRQYHGSGRQWRGKNPTHPGHKLSPVLQHIRCLCLHTGAMYVGLQVLQRLRAFFHAGHAGTWHKMADANAQAASSGTQVQHPGLRFCHLVPTLKVNPRKSHSPARYCSGTRCMR